MEANTVVRAIAVLTLALLAACQSAAPSPTAAPAATTAPTLTSVSKLAAAASPSAVAATSPSPSAAAVPRPTTVTAAAPAVGSSRIEVLNAANIAYARGDLAGASQLYERVLNTPPTGESAEQTAAINGLSGFQAVLTLLATGREDEAQSQLQALQQRDANAPFARLATQLWDQYGMVGGVRGACAQLQPQVQSSVAPTLQALQATGVQIDAQSLCKLPNAPS